LKAKEVCSVLKDLIRECGNVEIISTSVIETHIVIVYKRKDGMMDICRSDYKIVE